MDICITRSVKMKNCCYKIGDIIEFTLVTGEKTAAIAVKEENENMIFCLYDCLEKEYSMCQLLNGALNGEILEMFPEEIKKEMFPFESGNLLRLPTEKEMFGKNEFALESELEEIEQFEPMKLRRNRIANQGLNGEIEWYWLENKTVASAVSFAFVNSLGVAHAADASNSFGVRPLFKLKNDSEDWLLIL